MLCSNPPHCPPTLLYQGDYLLAEDISCLCPVPMTSSVPGCMGGEGLTYLPGLTLHLAGWDKRLVRHSPGVGLGAGPGPRVEHHPRLVGTGSVWDGSRRHTRALQVLKAPMGSSPPSCSLPPVTSRYPPLCSLSGPHLPVCAEAGTQCKATTRQTTGPRWLIPPEHTQATLTRDRCVPKPMPFALRKREAIGGQVMMGKAAVLALRM